MNIPLPNKAHSAKAAVAFGCFALGIQIAGLAAAVLTPYDNQGAVGKALMALLTQFVAVPAALTGLVHSIVGRWRSHGFSKRLAFGLGASIAGMIPLALVYVKVVA